MKAGYFRMCQDDVYVIPEDKIEDFDICLSAIYSDGSGDKTDRYEMFKSFHAEFSEYVVTRGLNNMKVIMP